MMMTMVVVSKRGVTGRRDLRFLKFLDGLWGFGWQSMRFSLRPKRYCRQSIPIKLCFSRARIHRCVATIHPNHCYQMYTISGNTVASGMFVCEKALD